MFFKSDAPQVSYLSVADFGADEGGWDAFP